MMAIGPWGTRGNCRTPTALGGTELRSRGAAIEIDELCALNWNERRATLFLPPFGMHGEWPTIEAIGRTHSIDLHVLYPAGAAACCAAYATLSPSPGVPISVPHAPRTSVNVDQVLDVEIAKLRSMLPPDADVTTESVRFPFLGGT
jgi:hypothetical protein